MDPIVAQNITFLDLSDVDDREREEVLNSLFEENAKVQLPWKISEHIVNLKTDAKCQYNASANHHLETFDLVPQHQIYPSNQLEHDTYIHHQNHYKSINAAVCPTSIAYTISPQYVVYPTLPSNYHPPFSITPVVSSLPNVTYANNFTPEATQSTQIQYINKVESHTQHTKSEPEKEATIDINTNTEATHEVVHNHQNGIVQKDESLEEKAIPSNQSSKSWASLFSGAKSSNVNVQNGNNLNEKSSNEAAVYKQNEDDLCPIRYPRKMPFIDPNCYRMAELLLNHRVDGKTISLQPRGLINRSNYCYINSILQALLACPPIYNLLASLAEQNTSAEKKKSTPIIDGMCRFVKEFQHLSAGQRINRRNDKNQKKDHGVTLDYDLPFEPSWIYKMLNGIRSDSFLVEGRQEDAEEFLGCLLNGLNDEMLELMKLVKSDLDVNKFDALPNDVESDKEWQVMGPKNKGSITRQTEFVKTPISNIFGGFLKSRIHRTGDHSTYNIQPFFTLQLNIEKVKTVREALEVLVSKNQLQGVTSEKTNEEVEAWQQVTLEELPVVLILHLKCFDFKLDGCTKIVKALEFPIDLKIDSKLLSPKTFAPKEKQYKLFAVVYHDGKEATKGHYITDAFHVGYSSWIRYDDASVKIVQEDYVLKPQGTRVPYLLFYRRSDTIRGK